MIYLLLAQLITSVFIPLVSGNEHARLPSDFVSFYHGTFVIKGLHGSRAFAIVKFHILSKKDGLHHRFLFSTISFKVADSFQIVT